MVNEKRCGTCMYSIEYKTVDPIISSMKNKLQPENQKIIGPDIQISTKCHIKGKPEKVDPELDWCYQWRKNDDWG
jgi:hypothetical protein